MLWTGVVERERSEAGARLKRNRMVRRFLDLDSAAAMGDLRRIGGEAPETAALIVSWP